MQVLTAHYAPRLTPKSPSRESEKGVSSSFWRRHSVVPPLTKRERIIRRRLAPRYRIVLKNILVLRSPPSRLITSKNIPRPAFPTPSSTTNLYSSKHPLHPYCSLPAHILLVMMAFPWSRHLDPQQFPGSPQSVSPTFHDPSTSSRSH